MVDNTNDAWVAEIKAWAVKFHSECKEKKAEEYQAWLESDKKKISDMGNEETKNEIMNEFMATFQAADTNNN